MSKSGSKAGTFSLLVFALLSYLVLAASSSFWDRDEPRFARATVEMVESGDYLVPRFNEKLRPDKPPLIYWAMAATTWLFGRAEVAFRLPSILGLLIATLATAAIGRRLFDEGVARRALLVLPGCFLAVYMGGGATADGLLLATTTSAFLPIADRLRNGPRRWQWPAFALLCGLAQLAKGPVGLAVPGLGVLGFGLWRRGRLGPRFAVGFIASLLVSIGIFCAWGIPANLATDGRFLELGLGRHVGERMVSPQEGHGGTGILRWLLFLPFYLPVILLGSFPWSGAFLRGARSLWRPQGAEAESERTVEARSFLLAWILPTLFLMSLVATKLPHYILPIFPPLAIAAAASDWFTTPARRWELRSMILSAGLIALALMFLFFALPSVWLGTGCLVVILLLAGLTRIAGEGSERRKGPAFFIVAQSLIIVLGLGVIRPLEPELKGADAVAKAAAPWLARHPKADVVLAGYGEPSVVFALDRPLGSPTRGMKSRPERLREWASLDEPGLFVTTERWLRKCELTPPELGLDVLWEREIVRYSRWRRVRVLVLTRGSKR